MNRTKILLSFTHPHVVPNPYDLYGTERKIVFLSIKKLMVSKQIKKCFCLDPY